MSSADDIAQLDRDIARYGEDIVLRRPGIDLTVRAHVRTFRQEEITGGVMLGDLKVILSPTGLDASAWLAAASAGTPPFDPDRRVPRRNEKAIVQGRLRNVENPMPFVIGGELVRIELVVRG